MEDTGPNAQADSCGPLGGGSDEPRIPDHELLHRIGEGSYGEVWLARTVTGQHRAVKVIYRTLFQTSRPFDREFAGMKRYEPVSRSHGGLVNILHVGVSPDRAYFYYVMELADDCQDGSDVHVDRYTPRTLSRERRCHNRLPPEECLRIGLALTEALEHLHARNLVHRDIKPSNIIFVGGVPKLADIGLVAELGNAASFVGTEGFIPPEGPGSVQADIYALGKVLYEIVTGKDRCDFPELPTALGDPSDGGLLLSLNEVIIRACHANTTRRYAVARSMGDDLRRLQRGLALRRTSWLTSWRGQPLGLRLGVWLVLPAVLLAGWFARRVDYGGRERREVHPTAARGSLQSSSAVGPFQPISPINVVGTAGATVVADSFDGAELDGRFWVTGAHVESARDGCGRSSHRIAVKDGWLWIETEAEHEAGWSQVQHAWVQSVHDLRGRGDALIELVISGRARNGLLRIQLGGDDTPRLRDDPAIMLFEAQGGNNRPDELDLPATRMRVEVYESSQLALVNEGDRLRLVDLSALPVWKLCIVSQAVTSAGFRPGQALLGADEVTITRLPEQTGLIGSVTNEITGRPVPMASVLSADGGILAVTNAEGVFALLMPSGSVKIMADKERFARTAPLEITLEAGHRTPARLVMRPTGFGFGDVVESVHLGAGHPFAIEVTPQWVYYAAGEGPEDVQASIFRMPTRGGDAVAVATAESLRGLVMCGEQLYLTAAWEGRLYRLAGDLLEHVTPMRGAGFPAVINWPHDAAWDGRYLWFVECTTIEERFGLYAYDLASKRVAIHLPTRERTIQGLAWDGRRLWISTRSGRVFEIDPALAVAEGSVEAGQGREFTGHYSSLAYADGYLWGLDKQMKRLCKIEIGH